MFIFHIVSDCYYYISVSIIFGLFRLVQYSPYRLIKLHWKEEDKVQLLRAIVANELLNTHHTLVNRWKISWLVEGKLQRKLMHFDIEGNIGADV